MKILILSQYWYPENGVPQRRWSWLSKVLDELGHDVTVIAPPPHYGSHENSHDRLSTCITGETEIGPSNERIVRCRHFGSSNSLTVRAFNQAVVAASMAVTAVMRRGSLRGYKPDVVIGTIPAIPTSWMTWFVARAIGKPFILDLRDAWPELLYERDSWNDGTGKKSLRERLLTKGPIQVVSRIVEKLMYASYRHSNAMIFTAGFLEDQMRNDRRAVGSQTGKPCVTIRNVFPPKTTCRDVDRVNRPTNELNVLYAGTLGRAQKLSNALDAVRLAQEQGVQVNLRLVGAGATRNALKEQINRESLSVELRGKVPAEQLGADYEWADTALVHLTDWSALKAAIPSKTFELMQLGIHISGSIAGETANLIRETNAGDVVPPANPQALANLWVELARNRERLVTDGKAKEWVIHQRTTHARDTLAWLMDYISGLREGNQK